MLAGFEFSRFKELLAGLEVLRLPVVPRASCVWRLDAAATGESLRNAPNVLDITDNSSKVSRAQ